MRAEEEQTALRLTQLAQRADRLDQPCSGRFLASEDRGLAERIARQQGVTAAFDGGYPEAERTQVCFHPPGEEPTFTAVWMEVRWAAKFATADHRALLGSLMALGMDRAFIGDILVGEGAAHLMVLPELAVRLPVEWTKAGGTSIRVKELTEPPVLTLPQGTLLRDTVASLRLDSVLASGMKTSRAKAAELIREGVVMVDHRLTDRVDDTLETGQLISVRGFGRMRLTDVQSPTRKDRLPITLEVFGK